MEKHARRLVTIAVALSAAVCSAGPLASTSAAAHGDRSALRAERQAEHAQRAEERKSRAQQRREAREQERSQRREEREAQRSARREARAQEPSQRQDERGGASQGATQGTNGGGEGQTPAAGGQPATPSDTELKHCHTSIESGAAQVLAGEAVTLFGKLSCPSGTSVAGREVTVVQREQGGSAADFATLGVATTEADGSYQLTSGALQANTIFRVRGAGHGAHATVKVAPLVTLDGPSPTAQLSTAGARPHGAHPARVTFTGTVDPGGAGARVSLQIADLAAGGQWHTVRFADVADDGSYAVAHSFRTAGQFDVRVLVHTHRHNVPAASEPILYEVVQAQNPKLTISASPDPADYGATVTITGAAAEAQEQPVTLLARGHGGKFTPVASGTTDDEGHYSFTQTATQNTAYRVSSGATTLSTVLYLAVRRVLAQAPAPGEVPAGQAATFTGTVTPAADGQVVYLERQNSGGTGFHVIASGTVSASSYSISHAFTHAGSATLRITVPGDATFVPTVGAPFALLVTPAAATTLTPEAPAPAPAGVS
ncbi:MAG TPA: hypothetical protein VL988_06830 [Solirubrobacteraceae bacterium]|nr:hypothetical protein [Solirubrobacteraceae bacterium]